LKRVRQPKKKKSSEEGAEFPWLGWGLKGQGRGQNTSGNNKTFEKKGTGHHPKQARLECSPFQHKKSDIRATVMPSGKEKRKRGEKNPMGHRESSAVNSQKKKTH